MNKINWLFILVSVLFILSAIFGYLTYYFPKFFPVKDFYSFTGLTASVLGIAYGNKKLETAVTSLEHDALKIINRIIKESNQCIKIYSQIFIFSDLKDDEKNYIDLLTHFAGNGRMLNIACLEIDFEKIKNMNQLVGNELIAAAEDVPILKKHLSLSELYFSKNINEQVNYLKKVIGIIQKLESNVNFTFHNNDSDFSVIVKNESTGFLGGLHKNGSIEGAMILSPIASNELENLINTKIKKIL